LFFPYLNRTAVLNDDIADYLSALGLRQSLMRQFQHPYLSVIDKGKVTYELLGTDNVVSLRYSGILADGTIYEIYSAPTPAGSCSIRIEGFEYAVNYRGLNFVIYDNETGEIADSVAFDTWSKDLTMHRLYY
jgi:hypothetical protein